MNSYDKFIVFLFNINFKYIQITTVLTMDEGLLFNNKSVKRLD